MRRWPCACAAWRLGNTLTAALAPSLFPTPLPIHSPDSAPHSPPAHFRSPRESARATLCAAHTQAPPQHRGALSGLQAALITHVDPPISPAASAPAWLSQFAAHSFATPARSWLLSSSPAPGVNLAEEEAARAAARAAAARGRRFAVALRAAKSRLNAEAAAAAGGADGDGDGDARAAAAAPADAARAMAALPPARRREVAGLLNDLAAAAAALAPPGAAAAPAAAASGTNASASAGALAAAPPAAAAMMLCGWPALASACAGGLGAGSAADDAAFLHAHNAIMAELGKVSAEAKAAAGSGADRERLHRRHTDLVRAFYALSARDSAAGLARALAHAQAPHAAAAAAVRGLGRRAAALARAVGE